MRLLNTHRILRPMITAMATVMLFSSSAGAQAMSSGKILPPAKRAAHVWITEGPALESVKDNTAIIRWTSNNPGGSDEHFGIVHYGTDPEHLDQTAKSHIRLNQNHATTTFRVLVDSLRPQTKYYYTVDSMTATGQSDGVMSPVAHFSNP